jgi:hypothetical protein
MQDHVELFDELFNHLTSYQQFELLNRSTADLVLGVLKDDENELIQDFLNEIT